ncbi:MAG: glycosyltransferase family 9 protein [Anaerolineales bacterium]|nr:glycosyltransferase family 9 protein [Anaerolineales bacterium]
MELAKLTHRDTRLEAILQKDCPRILVVVRDHMSGLLYAVPVLRSLRMEFPSAKIMLLANHYAAPILKNCPYLDRIVHFYLFREQANWFTRVEAIAYQAQALLQLYQKVDLVLHLRFVGDQTLLFSRMLGRPFQVGYEQGRYDHFLDINLGLDEGQQDSRTRNAKILEAIGLKVHSYAMEIWIPSEAEAWARQWLYAQGWQEGAPFFVFHPGCHWGCNEWLAERWADLGNEIHARFQSKIVITGTANERSLAEQIAHGMGTPPILATGETTMLQFAAILKLSTAVISVDTAPTQICQALNKPSVILMGAGNPAWNGPLEGEPMVMLQKLKPEENKVEHCHFAAGICHTNFCESRLKNISVENVVTALKKVCAGHFGITQYSSFE